VLGSDRCDQGGRILEREPVAQPHPPAVARQRIPHTVRVRTIQRDADPRVTPASVKLGGKHPGIVGNQNVTAAQQRGQVPHPSVRQARIMNVQHPRRIARADWMVGDAVCRQLVIEIRQRQVRR
jgi:hypothetical protein